MYLALTNNTTSARTLATVDEANPVTGNRNGHIIEITETAGQAGHRRSAGASCCCAATRAVDQNTYFAGFPKELVSPISCPDNVAFDSEGNLWISTDGAPSTIGFNDGLFKVPLEGPERGRVQQFLSVPRDAETCGPVIHDQEGMVFVAVQHPGENGSVAAPHLATSPTTCRRTAPGPASSQPRGRRSCRSGAPDAHGGRRMRRAASVARSCVGHASPTPPDLNRGRRPRRSPPSDDGPPLHPVR